MPYRKLCNDVQREGVKLSPELASGLFCYVPLHKIWYGIPYGEYDPKEIFCEPSRWYKPFEDEPISLLWKL